MVHPSEHLLFLLLKLWWIFLLFHSFIFIKGNSTSLIPRGEFSVSPEERELG